MLYILSLGKEAVLLCQWDKSLFESINHGVPQGSCLGSLLFLMYINDLPLVIKNATLSIFADNTGLMAASESFPHLRNLIEEDIQSLVTR